MDWTQSIYLLYFNKTVVPCGGAAFLLCSFAEPLYEHMGLMEHDATRKYCVFIHEERSEHTERLLRDEKC